MGNKFLAIILIFIFSFFVSAVNASTEIYKYVDSDGRITFTNKPIKGAKKFHTVPSSFKLNDRTLPNKKTPTVSNPTQKERDLKRRELIENELKTESKLLLEAKQVLNRALNDSEMFNIDTTQSQQEIIKHKIKIKLIEKRVLLHERNIAALKKELANL